MALSKLIYTSAMSHSCDLKEIENILVQSRSRNTIKNITGILYYSNKFFFQYLEGELNDIEQLFQSIAKDKRHTDVRLIEVSSIEHREFGDWSMAYILQSERLIPLYQKLFKTEYFDPSKITAEKARILTLTLKKELPKAYCSNSGVL
ncbi:BLUF domain-containing protein [Vibrio sp. T11.5]|uniref:BLUF domain-containing protein n=1 Tax=Vibrio sp. T11.5 TaxID=2998836 RepID=UPI0022CD5FC6|nr:BLUF domain-containing protein [Vibrio sp. T11.5]MDA0116892.1 BLUF domain-containing protein [Vibrio sp. T11.5]